MAFVALFVLGLILWLIGKAMEAGDERRRDREVRARMVEWCEAMARRCELMNDDKGVAQFRGYADEYRRGLR